MPFNSILSPCSETSFVRVQQYVLQFELDDRQLKKEEFLTLNNPTELIGFVRLRQYDGFAELCSLGVVEKARHHGVAHRLVKAVTESAQQTLYLVCVIPTFFEELGFQLCENFPPEIADKLAYCRESLAIAEDYVVMKLG